MIQITKISIQNLLEFINSEQYNSLINKPISPSRVTSYLQNPNATKNDIVLYMAFLKNELVGYRTVFADVFYNEGEKVRFAWLSGNWTHPKYRRQNISTLLFNEILTDWESKVMYSNYAQESKLLYDKTNQFTVLKQLNGKRYYIKFCLADILPQKHLFFKKTQFLLKRLDAILNLFNQKRFSYNISSTIQIQKITKWDNLAINQFLNAFKKQELFRRNTQIYEWIEKHPWIKTDLQTKQFAKSYYFSSYAVQFDNDFYLIKNNNTTIAILQIIIKNNFLKVPYYYGLKESALPTVKYILDTCNLHKIKHLTIYNSALINELNKYSFLYKKNFIQIFFISKTLIYNKNIFNKEIQSGDGDSTFT